MLAQVLDAITTKYGTHWHRIRDKFHDSVAQFQPTFIHDTQDKFAPFEHVHALIATAPERFNSNFRSWTSPHFRRYWRYQKYYSKNNRVTDE